MFALVTAMIADPSPHLVIGYSCGSAKREIRKMPLLPAVEAKSIQLMNQLQEMCNLFSNYELIDQL